MTFCNGLDIKEHGKLLRENHEKKRKKSFVLSKLYEFQI